MEKLGQNNIYSQYLGNKAILRTYKGINLINEYVPLYTPPVDWSDIRTDCPENSIALYAAHSADYSSYNNLGFTATCTGGYKVYIDGNVYGSYASGSTCSITWSTSGITTGDSITTPSALKAHKIWVEPATAGNNITAFQCKRVAASGTEQQGVLWANFNLSNEISLSELFRDGNKIVQRLVKAITAKNNKIIVSSIAFALKSSIALEYLPILIGNISKTYNLQECFYDCRNIKRVSLQDMRITYFPNAFYNCFKLSDINKRNISATTTASAGATDHVYQNCYVLKEILPFTVSENFKYMGDFITNATALKEINIDVRLAPNLLRIGCYGTSQYFMQGFKGLRVSNQAPFTGAAPQINVSYTGMDRTALVQLFNDLPYNVGYEAVGSPTISSGVVSGFSSSDYVKATNINAISLSDIHSYTTRVCFTTGDSLAVNNQIIGGVNAYFGFRQATGPQGSLRAVIFDVRNGLFKDLLITTSLQVNTSYIAEQVSNQNECYARFSADGGTTWTRVDTEGTSSYSTSFQNINIGYGTFGAFTGSIDLNNTYIKINDVYWFRGQPAMTKTLSCVGCSGNQNNLTIVGSPTISNGVISGLSANDYVYTTRSTAITSDIMEIGGSFTMNANGEGGWIFSNINSSTAWQGFALSVRNTSDANQGILLYSGTSKYFFKAKQFLANTIYNYKIVYSKENHSAELFIDNVSQGSLSELEWDVKLGGDFLIGKYSTDYFKGDINLNNIYIKVNNQLWFGREQYLLPEDKAIATNKNWTLTLS